MLFKNLKVGDKVLSVKTVVMSSMTAVYHVLSIVESVVGEKFTIKDDQKTYDVFEGGCYSGITYGSAKPYSVEKDETAEYVSARIRNERIDDIKKQQELLQSRINLIDGSEYSLYALTQVLTQLGTINETLNQ